MDMDMGSTDDSTSNSTSSMMMVVFQNEIATSLYSSAWTPSTTATYAATCIFLVTLSILFRCALAAKALQEGKWIDAELNRRYVVVQGKIPLSEQVSRDSLSKKMTLTENGVEEDVMVVRKRRTHVLPWRLSIDPVRALMDTIVAGLGYLLMLAVMTLNIGYFLSILAGTFLGSLLVGRFIVATEH